MTAFFRPSSPGAKKSRPGRAGARATDPSAKKFDDQGIHFAVQSGTGPNAAGTANVSTASNVARGAAVALTRLVPTYDSKGNVQSSVVQSIDPRGDGASVNTQQSFSTTASITSTGPLGDLTLNESQGLANLTAPSVFGSINLNGPITGLDQTTGQRTDPITSAVTTVSADLGSLYVDTTRKPAGGSNARRLPFRLRQPDAPAITLPRGRKDGGSPGQKANDRRPALLIVFECQSGQIDAGSGQKGGTAAAARIP